MAKIEANKLELTPGEFNLEQMIEKVINVVNFRIDQKHQNLLINITSSVPKNIVCDEMRLTQVLTNLLTNASKFTPEAGTIKLSVTKSLQEGALVTLKFDVEDNGIGISPEQKARLFKSFEQADGSISRKFGGTGLGLAISKRIVELMNGKIDVESESGKGSKFTFTIKAEKGKSSGELKLHPSINLNNLKVLAVDDAKEIRDYFSSLMEKFSIHCDVAEGSSEALKIIEKNANTPYNIIFVDWMMPVMDGIELTKEIKKNAPENCIVIMISTAQWAEIENIALDAGVDRFIGKPLFPSAIINIINECCSGGVMLNSVSTSNKEGVRKKPNYEGQYILVAEDTEINREIIKAFLQNTKVKLDFATNGLEAVDAFKAAPEKYSLILMDVQMPKMDGLEATKTIRALDIERAKNIPIIALTANVFLEDIKECLAAGMNSHIGKPVEINSMFETLSNYMTETAGSHNSAENTAGGQANYSKYMPFINVEDGLGRLMNDKKLYFHLLSNFDGKKFSEDLIKSISEGDFKTIAVTAHTIKGIAANLGLTSFMDLSKDIEIQAKQESDLSVYIEKINTVAIKTLEAITELTKS